MMRSLLCSFLVVAALAAHPSIAAARDCSDIAAERARCNGRCETERRLLESCNELKSLHQELCSQAWDFTTTNVPSDDARFELHPTRGLTVSSDPGRWSLGLVADGSDRDFALVVARQQTVTWCGVVREGEAIALGGGSNPVDPVDVTVIRPTASDGAEVVRVRARVARLARAAVLGGGGEAFAKKYREAPSDAAARQLATDAKTAKDALLEQIREATRIVARIEPAARGVAASLRALDRHLDALADPNSTRGQLEGALEALVPLAPKIAKARERLWTHLVMAASDARLGHATALHLPSPAAALGSEVDGGPVVITQATYGPGTATLRHRPGSREIVVLSGVPEGTSLGTSTREGEPRQSALDQALMAFMRSVIGGVAPLAPPAAPTLKDELEALVRKLSNTSTVNPSDITLMGRIPTDVPHGPRMSALTPGNLSPADRMAALRNLLTALHLIRLQEAHPTGYVSPVAAATAAAVLAPMNLTELKAAGSILTSSLALDPQGPLLSRRRVTFVDAGLLSRNRARIVDFCSASPCKTGDGGNVVGTVSIEPEPRVAPILLVTLGAGGIYWPRAREWSEVAADADASIGFDPLASEVFRLVDRGLEPGAAASLLFGFRCGDIALGLGPSFWDTRVPTFRRWNLGMGFRIPSLSRNAYVLGLLGLAFDDSPTAVEASNFSQAFDGYIVARGDDGNAEPPAFADDRSFGFSFGIALAIDVVGVGESGMKFLDAVTDGD